MENKVENKNVNQINFDYNGKHYCLEYTLDTIKRMEAIGFDLDDIGSKPATRLEQLWHGAFLANCRKTSDTVIKDLFKKMRNKDELFTTLTTMYNNTLSQLAPDEDDEGNVEWTATP